MKIIAFIKRQITVNNWKDACFLLLKLLFVVFLINELYDEIQYQICLFKIEKSDIALMVLKRLFFAVLVCAMWPYVTRLKKTGRIVLCIITIIILWINGSILGIFFVDGPYWGKVVDAETGEPIAGANVVGQWTVKSWFLWSGGDRQDLRETTTNKNGWFFLPIGRTVMFYPLSILDYTYIYVYKPGYDSRPPLMDNCWTEDDEKKRGMTRREYRDKYSDMKKFYPNTITLYRALSYEEQREVLKLDFDIDGEEYNRVLKYRIINMIETIEKEKTRLRKFIKVD
ncbi:MAG: hypothetical protein JW832_06860 [Deltaproteobacteria bacterium]|nr:hypothetical protein [Deltaproteobacteria bacterium]